MGIALVPVLEPDTVLVLVLVMEPSASLEEPSAPLVELASLPIEALALGLAWVLVLEPDLVLVSVLAIVPDFPAGPDSCAGSDL